MKLAFKRLGFGFTEKEVEITLNIGTLEAVCKSLGIEFFQIGDEIKKNNFDFTVELLYQGYVTARKEMLFELRLSKIGLIFYILSHPKYDREKAFIWNEKLSKKAQKEFMEKMTGLFGEITKLSGKSKKKVKQPLKN